MKLIGVDGCKSGWFFVSLYGEEIKFGVVPYIGELVNDNEEELLIFVDIPIGLRDTSSEPRECDTVARKLLGQKRSSSVFPAPIREILNEKTHTEAAKKSKRLSGKSLSQQAFAIIPKIREVDELLLNNVKVRNIVFEVHPELCFWGLSDGKAMNYGKKTEDGFKERMELLNIALPNADKIVSSALSTYLRKEVERDDILDALVAVVTASLYSEFTARAPKIPEKDSKGLPMQMIYPMVICNNAL